MVEEVKLRECPFCGVDCTKANAIDVEHLPDCWFTIIDQEALGKGKSYNESVMIQYRKEVIAWNARAERNKVLDQVLEAVEEAQGKLGFLGAPAVFEELQKIINRLKHDK